LHPGGDCLTVSTDPRIGSELAGYRIEALLGRGGMSVVYRAEDSRLKRKVALKLLAAELSEDDRFRERFLRESELAASLDHPNVIPIYEAGEVEGQLYIAMRYVEGRDLKSLLRAEAPLAPERALRLCGQVADALDAAHEVGLVHRDVKPGNVLLDRREHVYLADFGLTKQVSSQSGLTATGQIAGTIEYIAPEVIEGKKVDARADQYSLGCLLYECLAGSPPFHRDSELAVLWAHVHDPPPLLSERRPELGKELDAVLARALAKTPEKRYASCRELVDAARAALPEPEPAPPRGRRGLLLGAGALALVVATLAVVLTLAGGKSGPAAAPAPATPGPEPAVASAKPTTAVTTASIQRIDPKTNRLVATIEAPVGPAELVVAGGWVWAANGDENKLFRIDPERNAIVETLQGPGNPVELSYGAGRLWALNAQDGIVTQLDPSTGAVTGTVALPPGTWVLTTPLRATESDVWLSWVTSKGNAVRIDPPSKKATAVQIGPASLVQISDFAPTGLGALWVGAASSTHPSLWDVYEVDLREPDLSKTREIRVGVVLGALAADEQGVWASDFYGNEVVHVDRETRRIDRRVTVGSAPSRIAVGLGAVWVVNVDPGTISRIDPTTGKVVATIPVGPNPGAIVVGAGSVWVDVGPR